MEKENNKETKEINLDINRKIQLYDKMNQAYGVVPEQAGDEMIKIGLIGKAINYYSASGRGWEKECEELEKWVMKPQEKISQNTCRTRCELDKNPELYKRYINLSRIELHLPEFTPGYYFQAELNAGVGEKN